MSYNRYGQPTKDPKEIASEAVQIAWRLVESGDKHDDVRRAEVLTQIATEARHQADNDWSEEIDRLHAQNEQLRVDLWGLGHFKERAPCSSEECPWDYASPEEFVSWVKSVCYAHENLRGIDISVRHGEGE